MCNRRASRVRRLGRSPSLGAQAPCKYHHDLFGWISHEVAPVIQVPLRRPITGVRSRNDRSAFPETVYLVRESVWSLSFVQLSKPEKPDKPDRGDGPAPCRVHRNQKDVNRQAWGVRCAMRNGRETNRFEVGC